MALAPRCSAGQFMVENRSAGTVKTARRPLIWASISKERVSCAPSFSTMSLVIVAAKFVRAVGTGPSLVGLSQKSPCGVDR